MSLRIVKHRESVWVINWSNVTLEIAGMQKVGKIEKYIGGAADACKLSELPTLTNVEESLLRITDPMRLWPHDEWFHLRSLDADAEPSTSGKNSYITAIIKGLCSYNQELSDAPAYPGLRVRVYAWYT